jgi:hypothetical protein
MIRTPRAGLPDFPYILEQRRLHHELTVTAAEVSKNFGAYEDAAVREPVIVTKNGRPRTVMAYEDFVRLSKRDRRVERAADLSETEIAAVEAAEMTPDHNHLNPASDTKYAAD